MRSKIFTIISIVLNVVFLSGIIILGNTFYSEIKQKLFSLRIHKIEGRGFMRSALNSVDYYNASDFNILGKLPNTQAYSRLPEEAKDEVRKPVWNLSKNTAGISIRFTSNSKLVAIRWTLDSNPFLSTMTPIASKGLDLYTYENEKWHFVGSAEPQNSLTNEDVIIDDMLKGDREYLLNLPLYSGIKKLEIGIDHDAYIKTPGNKIIDRNNPIIFYGTSITQGASASRPGLTYPALIQRRLNKEVINLGFSRNGRFEKVVAKYFIKATPSLVVLDCTPNSPADTIRKNLPELIEYIRLINDTVPILFVESIVYDFSHFKIDNERTFGTVSFIEDQNNVLSEIYTRYSSMDKNLYYIKGGTLIGTDKEATVDGIHFNDVGHFRAYENLVEQIGVIISSEKDP